MAPPSLTEQYANQLDKVQRICEKAAEHCCCWHPDLLEFYPHPLCVPHQILQVLGVELQ